ncbi:MAG: SLC13 family permease [Solirubrobacteraceae bacterium]
MLLIVHVLLVLIAVAALALRPKSNLSTAVVALAAVTDVALGAAPGPVVSVITPLIAFLGAALTLAGFVQRSGLAERAACVLAAQARGSSLILYVLVCALCAALTVAISLDGAVVLMVPLLLVLTRRFDAPFAPLFLGAVVVANAASIAVPQGNPTNLVIISRLGLSATAFVEHMLAPGLAAAAICAAGVALWERRALAAPLRSATQPSSPLSRDEWHAVVSLAFAAVVAFVAPLAGIAPWWPFAGAVAVALAARRERPQLIVPWRVTIQVGGLLVATSALGLTVHAPSVVSLPALLAVAAALGAAAAVANNLPVSVCATGLLTAGAPAYAASVGLAIGSLATPQGSVATLIASQLAGPCAPRVQVRKLAPLAIAGLLAATLLLRATL